MQSLTENVLTRGWPAFFRYFVVRKNERRIVLEAGVAFSDFITLRLAVCQASTPTSRFTVANTNIV